MLRRELLVILGCSLLLTACGGDAAPPTATAAPTDHSSSATGGRPATSDGGAGDGDWSTGLDSRPTQGVVGERLAFVSTSGGAKFPPQLYALDVATGEVLQRRSAAGQPYDLLIAPDGRLWVAGDRHSDQPVGGGINVYEPSRLVAADHLDVAGVPLSLALVGEEIWIGSDRAIVAVDPATLAVLRTVAVAGSVNQLVTVPGTRQVVAVVVTDTGSTVMLLDPAGTTVAQAAVPADGSIVVAATDAELWARVPVMTDSTVVQLELPGLAATETGVTTDSAGGGLIATDDGQVVLADDRGDAVICVPADGAATQGVPDVEVASALAGLPGGGALFGTMSGVTARRQACSA